MNRLRTTVLFTHPTFIHYRWAVLLGYVAIGLLAGSAASAQEHCNALLVTGLKNIHRVSSSGEWRNYLYHEVCKRTDSGWSVDLGVFDLGELGISSQNVSDFCGEQSREAEGRSGEYLETSVLTKDHLQAWNECQALADKKVTISTNVGVRFVDFSVRRSAGVTAKIDNVNFDSGIATCAVAGGDGESRKIQSGEELSIQMNEEDHHIHCERSTESLNDREIFPRAEIVVTTSFGRQSVVLPPDEEYSPSLASEIRRRMQELDERLGSLNALAVRQCKVQADAMWGNCSPSVLENNPMRMPVVETSLTPEGGGCSEWSRWQIASEWDGDPWSCLRFRICCE